MLVKHRGGLSNSGFFLAWSSIAQSVCQWVFSLLAIWCLRPWIPILHSPEGDTSSLFNSKSACLYQSIEINNSKHVYRQNQLRKPTVNRIEWAECSPIIVTGCRVKVLSLILDSWVSLSAGIQFARNSVAEALSPNPAFSWRFGVWELVFEPCIQQRKTACLLSIWKSLARARASALTKTNMYITRNRCESQPTMGSSGLNVCW